ncbi:hypothetical protein PG991_010766 [Apiospora marii]|uniref:Uncharacterized protein n=1 Tax=Apiospora marii TaxID=335849 RepID=A0ABR1RCJ5_9PEZI
MRRPKKSCQGILPVWQILGILCCVAVPHFIYERGRDACRDLPRALHWCRGKCRRRRWAPRWARRKPVKLVDDGGPGDLRGKPASFAHLPLEIRHQIYDLVFEDEMGYIIEPQAVRGAHWGHPPRDWEATGQHVRSDRDSASRTLQLIMAVGGTEWRQRRGQQVQYRDDLTQVWPIDIPFQLVCGEQAIFEPVSSHPSPWQRSRASRRAPPYLDLMRTCHLVYGDMLDRLYGRNTISLFGKEIVGMFGRIAPEAGLARVRYVHVALTMDTGKPQSRSSIEKAVIAIRETLPGMRQLDLEIALVTGKPADPGPFWTWLCGMLERQLGTAGLEEFVLKAPVYSGKRWWPVDKLCPAKLSSWDEGDYRKLKTAVCTRGGFHYQEADIISSSE